MRAFKWKIALLVGCMLTSSKAPANPVGYYNLNISPGDNLIANQLSASADNTLDSVLPVGPLTGSTFTEWDPAANQLLPVSTYNGSSWSIDYTFAPNGVGGVLNSPSSQTITIVGVVVNMDSTYEHYEFTPPAYGPGTYLLALAAPLAAGATFQQIVGRAPDMGESVRTLNAATQLYSTTTFDGSVWNNGTPSLAVGQAAYFNLIAAPEPTTLALAGFGTAALIIFRRRNSQA